MQLNISPAVWQSYIKAILSCLSSRTYCERIIDDLLFLTPNKKAHMAKFRKFTQKWIQNISREMPVL